MKRKLTLLFLLVAGIVFFQPCQKVSARQVLKSMEIAGKRQILSEKIFPFLQMALETPELKNWMEQNEALKELLLAKKQEIKDSVALNGRMEPKPNEFIVAPFKINEQELATANAELASLSELDFMPEILKKMRAEKYFAIDSTISDRQLIVETFKREIAGVNQLINTYALAEKTRYSFIDSVSYEVSSDYYRKVIHITALNQADELDTLNVFYQPSLSFALWLLEINKRDEAARFEPMEYGENAKAVAQIKATNWDEYPYSVILVPGHGPEEEGVDLSPLGMMRCKLAADRYFKGLAPLIILSGGYVHPFQTPFCEATEMKKVLMYRYKIPESALIIEPHARHTTTNFRNAARLIEKYGIPMTKKALCTTTVDQSFYITHEYFQKRCAEELGYMPYISKDRLSRNDVEFVPTRESLFIDNKDPLDP
ncbi:YdcF family protein [Mangrovibacterium lignilyticum]|uniref:YdcF family protein n=1 Tax=Mangrovibacterium lignilyticum TaxID=2668052 RepID=UPI0013D83BDF|nr:YdcF family protein [Mangrovibacterium lignilyticum]